MKRILWGFALLCISFAAHAQYPNKPVRVVVPFPAGSSTDIITRVLTNSVSQAIGQQLVVDNKAGADGRSPRRTWRRPRLTATRC